MNAVIVCDPKTDIFNPNIIRSSIGCVFTTRAYNVYQRGSHLTGLKRMELSVFATSLEASDHYLKGDFTKPTAIVVGTES
ncbi:MAG: hypothetical protein R2764_17630 [Bacteroidales bacterium]